MHRARLASAILAPAVMLLAGGYCAAFAATARSAPAASPAPTERPYKPVAVMIRAAPADPSFARFRGDLAKVAVRRVYLELARRVVARGFFWERDFGGGYEPGKSGVDNLATAISLERGDGAGWRTLAAFAAETTATPIESRPGVICAPAKPQFDEIAFNALVDTTQTDGVDWVYPRSQGVMVRAAANTGSAAIETIGLHFVRRLGYEAKVDDPDRGRTAWTRVATPAGRIGFIAPGTLASLFAERLCYTKDGTGRWRIAGYVGGSE